jgi:anti-anti-sigma regulatory factor
MSIRVHVQTVAGDTIISLDGAVDADLIGHLGDGIAAVAGGTSGRVLVDIEHLTLLDDAGFGDLVDQLVAAADGRSGIIARRTTTRQVLAHWGIPGRIPIYDGLPKETPDP